MTKPDLLSDTDFEAQVTPKKDEKPASRWRNKWRNTAHVGKCEHTGRLIAASEIYWGVFVWPTKEVAEQKADDAFARHPTATYLGAFPVDGDA